MMKITSGIFGYTKNNEAVTRFILQDGDCQVAVLTLGGIIQSVVVPDKEGNPTDVVLGFDHVEDYEKQTCYIGALLGRSANRTVKGDIFLDEKLVTLTWNENDICQLHGGYTGFDRKIWQAEETEEGLRLSCISEDGEEGYPGVLKAEVTYSLQDGALSLHYRASASETTLCNLSNHAYFNLGGHDSGSVGEQKLKIHAGYFTPVTETHAPDGRVVSLEGTPLDFRTSTALADRWDAEDEQIALAAGYDHHYIIEGFGMRTFAQADCAKTGIQLEVKSDMPGMQLYTGNFLNDLPAGKGGASYTPRTAFCMETQFIPNAVNCPAFEAPVLKAGEVYDKTTIYQFSVKE